MLHKLSNEISEYYRHAEDCRRKSDETKVPTAKQELLDMGRRWLFLARSYELTERLTDFADYAKTQMPRRPP
jgi:hypothetical protein